MQTTMVFMDAMVAQMNRYHNLKKKKDIRKTVKLLSCSVTNAANTGLFKQPVQAMLMKAKA